MNPSPFGTIVLLGDLVRRIPLAAQAMPHRFEQRHAGDRGLPRPNAGEKRLKGRLHISILKVIASVRLAFQISGLG